MPKGTRPIINRSSLDEHCPKARKYQHGMVLDAMDFSAVKDVSMQGRFRCLVVGNRDTAAPSCLQTINNRS